MVEMQKTALKLAFLCVLSVCSVHCNDTKFKSNFNIVEHLKKSFYAKSDLNITNVLNEFVAHNWTENYGCLTELIAIKNGIINFDEWAITRKFMAASPFPLLGVPGDVFTDHLSTPFFWGK